VHIDVTSTKCSGCSGCFAVCPKKAISMEKDKEGFLIPMVDRRKCVECGACVRICPAKQEQKVKENICYSYAAKLDDKYNDIRKNSASGGVFPALAKYALEIREGYVCGCVLDNMLPKHIISQCWDDVEKMQDSKYVQSDMQSCIKDIGDLLHKGKFVLFVGTSCQVAGLEEYLDIANINKANLLTVDFFCHGVPSPMIWDEYIDFYKNKKKRTPVNYRFRSKEYGWGMASRGSNCLGSVVFGKQVNRRDNFSWAARMWRSIFFSNLCIRQYCHQCPYASAQKPSDITIGDFWGIEDICPDFDDGKGCSVMIIRSSKAKCILKQTPWLVTKDVTLEEAVKKQGNAFAPSIRNERRDAFWNDYYKNGFEYVANKYFQYDGVHRMKALIKRILFALKIRNIY